jgi:Type II secretion system (T2SS), protein M subtype b
MTLTTRDRRALVALAVAGVALVIYLLTSSSASTPTAQVVSLNSAQLRQRLTLLRQTAAVLPAREALLKQATADLADREHGLIQAGTAAEAQSELLQTAVRLGKSNGLEVRSSDFAAPKVFGDYGLVYASVSFDCHVEQLLNFLADLTHEPELIVPSEERIGSSGNAKDKMMTVRIVLAGVVAKKLIPEKKALGAF